MRIVCSACALFALLSPVALQGATPRAFPATSAPSAPAQLTASFSIDSLTTVPGKILKPGSYTIRVVDHLSDRIVLRIEDPEGKTATTFLGLPASGMSGAGAGPVSWTNSPKGSHALRGFAFAGGSSVEFVYPKEEAVAIAKVNSSKVAAIDPASDNLPAHSNLSRDDMQMVTLWSLSSTRVGPNDTPAIQAEHYKAQNTVVAQSAPTLSPVPSAAPARAYAASSTSSDRLIARPARPAPAPQIAALHRPGVVSSLPHTASTLPVVLLLTVLSLFAAAALRLSRYSRAE